MCTLNINAWHKKVQTNVPFVVLKMSPGRKHISATSLFSLDIYWQYALFELLKFKHCTFWNLQRHYIFILWNILHGGKCNAKLNTDCGQITQVKKHPENIHWQLIIVVFYGDINILHFLQTTGHVTLFHVRRCCHQQLSSWCFVGHKLPCFNWHKFAINWIHSRYITWQEHYVYILHYSFKETDPLISHIFKTAKDLKHFQSLVSGPCSISYRTRPDEVPLELNMILSDGKCHYRFWIK